jgi:hypothetical protein
MSFRAGAVAWNASMSWNVCKTRTCRGPVEGDGGSVDFFDGSKVHCIECGREYLVHVADGCTPSLERVRAKTGR